MYFLMVIALVVGLIPYMIYMKWFIPCPACGKRGTLESKKKATLKTKLDGRKLNDTWLYFVCRHCGKIRKNMHGTWQDVEAKEWEMVMNSDVLIVQPLDEHKVKPTKKRNKKSNRKIRD
jgi:phage terminase large subunit GpA-like protein